MGNWYYGTQVIANKKSTTSSIQKFDCVSVSECTTSLARIRLGKGLCYCFVLFGTVATVTPLTPPSRRLENTYKSHCVGIEFATNSDNWGGYRGPENLVVSKSSSIKSLVSSFTLTMTRTMTTPKSFSLTHTNDGIHGSFLFARTPSLSLSLSLSLFLALSLFVSSQPRRHQWGLSTRASERAMAATRARTLGAY